MASPPSAVESSLRYLAGLSSASRVLWCYLLWYLVILACYFDANPRLWLTSLGLSGIIGFALVLNAGGWRRDTRRGQDGWQTFRFFLMPFCVSSFATLVKDRGFFLVFSPRWGELVACIAVCLTFLGITCLAAARRRSGRSS